MGYYKSPKDMFTQRADKFKRDGDRHWAQAKNGEGDFHFGKAKDCYGRAEEARERARNASDSPFSKKDRD